MWIRFGCGLDSRIYSIATAWCSSFYILLPIYITNTCNFLTSLNIPVNMSYWQTCFSVQYNIRRHSTSCVITAQTTLKRQLSVNDSYIFRMYNAMCIKMQEIKLLHYVGDTNNATLSTKCISQWNILIRMFNVVCCC